MARKVVDTYPVFTITVGVEAARFGIARMSREEARIAESEIRELISTVLQRTTRRQMDVESKIVEEVTCEHCGWRWTETSPDYNGGCCGKDEANSPDRLRELADNCGRVSCTTYYPFDDEIRGRVAVAWPNTLADLASTWLSDGRLAGVVQALLPLIRQVKGRDWCTVWTDPGPNGCSLARLPDQVSRADGPELLADDLLSLIDDMGLLPATAKAAQS